MPTDANTSPVVLSIAGFDPSGCAGLIADVRALVAFGCRPAAAMTSLTFQNSERFFGAVHQSAETLRAQILPVIEEFQIAAVKTGMLPTPELVLELARLLRETELPSPVADPVLRSSSGHELMEPAAREAWLTELMPLARVITPNIPEAENLTGISITNEPEMRKAAGRLREMGARAVLLKGGHLRLPSEAIDVLDDDGTVKVFRGEWIEAPPARGTGCMLSAAVAACIGKGMSLDQAVCTAKEFVARQISTSIE
jgi:hydroxymethylpyrimidine/phosphomethylpyrimidine kinase